MPIALLSIETFLAAADQNWWTVVAFMVFGVATLNTLMGPITTRIKAGERERLRRMYERLALEKLDVIKTAVTMGYKQADLTELDSRLESVIGSQAMQRLLEGKGLSGGGKKSDSGTGTVIGINIQAGPSDKGGRGGSTDKTIDLDELVHSELADGLRRSQKQHESD